MLKNFLLGVLIYLAHSFFITSFERDEVMSAIIHIVNDVSCFAT